MRITEILSLYAGKEIRKVYRNSLGVKTSARLPQVQWEAIERYCVRQKTTPAAFLLALDLAIDRRDNFSSALRYLAIYIMEHPDDKVEFLIDK